MARVWVRVRARGTVTARPKHTTYHLITYLLATSCSRAREKSARIEGRVALNRGRVKGTVKVGVRIPVTLRVRVSKGLGLGLGRGSRVGWRRGGYEVSKQT